MTRAAANSGREALSLLCLRRVRRLSGELRHALTRPNVEIKIQEDFQALGGDTLAMLETYVEVCDVVIHFIGEWRVRPPRLPASMIF